MTKTSWSCRISRSLRRELMNAATDPSPFDSSVVTNADFPGIILSIDRTDCGGLAFIKESEATIAISDPVFVTPATPEQKRRWFQWMLLEVQAYSSRAPGSLVRSIQSPEPTESRIWITSSLKDAGFFIAAKTGYWVKRECDDLQKDLFAHKVTQPPAMSLKTLTFEKWSQDTRLLELLCELVNSILTDTQDLQGLPAATTQALMKQWLDQKASILLAEMNARTTGLCVVTKEFNGQSNASREYRIEYVGVRPESRHLGIASELIRHLPASQELFEQNSKEGPGIDTNPVCLTTFADQLNNSAVKLYQKLGFVREADFDVWCWLA